VTDWLARIAGIRGIRELEVTTVRGLSKRRPRVFVWRNLITGSDGISLREMGVTGLDGSGNLVSFID
jgi:hypothetical protein